MLFLRNKNVMWAPMYDNLSQSNNYWKIKYLNIKIFPFKSIKKLARYECKYLSLKYSVRNIREKALKKIKINIFFWFRNNIKFYDWIRKFNSNTINKIVFFNCPDPGRKHDKINEEDIKKFNIHMIKKSFLPKKKYISLIKNAKFICPRNKRYRYEFLEAMSMGKYLISYNDA